jgi:transketolase
MSNSGERANAIRALSMDAVQLANSGHPGMPMGMADIAEVLWHDHLRHNPGNPQWCNRDRFVVSNGHGSMLLYALLHLSGYDLCIDDLKAFRQLHSKTPGHPEYGLTPGVETTTGPLGQGLANAVGMAIAESNLRATFNREGFPIIDHYTYVFVGDGCLMEGISHEACSLAGTLGLGKLIVFYDDNGISIDGAVAAWFTDNTPARFKAYNWQVVEDVDGHNPVAIEQAIQQAKQNTQQPTLICCKTTIGFGSPNLAGKAKTHGAPLGDAEITLTRKQLNWPHPPFHIPTRVKASWDAKVQGEQWEQAWQQCFLKYQQHYPQLAQTFSRRLQGDLIETWNRVFDTTLETLLKAAQATATRKASLGILNQIAPHCPELMGGSADLSGSNLTQHEHARPLSTTDHSGNYIHYGVREFAMTAIASGLALHGGFIPYIGTFLVFSDYARNALRLAALMRQRVIAVYTHDSIGLGEDGPTHQPVEHITILRLTPNLHVWRPADSTETLFAWQSALKQSHTPTALLLSRQTLPFYERSSDTVEAIAYGGYVLRDSNTSPELIIIATGSEVALATTAYQQLQDKGIAARVVSMPCAEIFAQQTIDYRHQVLPPNAKKIAIEAGSTAFWAQYVGSEGKVIGIDRFGESAPAADVYATLEVTVSHIMSAASELLQSNFMENSV